MEEIGEVDPDELVPHIYKLRYSQHYGTNYWEEFDSLEDVFSYVEHKEGQCEIWATEIWKDGVLFMTRNSPYDKPSAAWVEVAKQASK